MTSKDRNGYVPTPEGLFVPGSWRNEGRARDNDHLSRVSAEDAEKLRQEGRRGLEAEIQSGLVKQLEERAARLADEARERDHQKELRDNQTKITALENALDLQKRIAHQQVLRAKQDVASRQRAAAERAAAERAAAERAAAERKPGFFAKIFGKNAPKGK